MTSLEHYVNNVRTLSQQGNFVAVVDLVNKSLETLGKNIPHLDNVLGTLDIKEHTLGVLGILWAKYSVPTIPDFETLFAQTQEFILTSSADQLKFAPENFSEICHKFTQTLVQRRQTIRGISLLSTAVKKIQASPSQLTAIHSDFCQLCLISKCLKPALLILDIDIADIAREGNNAIDVKYFLLYYYYGGMIYAAVKNMQRALLFFEIAVTTPSMAVSHIMLEAYKKYMLTCLIVNGKVIYLPRYTSHVVNKYLKPLCGPHQDLVNAYGSNRPIDVRLVMQKHSSAFERERNMGLVKQVLVSLFKRNIQRLTKTFVTLSLSDMANRVQLSGPEEAESYIVRMIADGEIHAVINQKDGMVQFLDNPEKYNNLSMLFRMDGEMKECIETERRLVEMDRGISLTQQYVQKSTKVQELDM